MENDKSMMYIVAIVAIIAVVALVIMAMNRPSVGAATPVSSEATYKPATNGDTAGQAFLRSNGGIPGAAYCCACSVSTHNCVMWSDNCYPGNSC